LIVQCYRVSKVLIQDAVGSDAVDDNFDSVAVVFGCDDDDAVDDDADIDVVGVDYVDDVDFGVSGVNVAVSMRGVGVKMELQRLLHP